MPQGKKLGYADCTLCGYQVVIRENARSLAYYSCEDCGCQHMSRGPDSDRLMRELIKKPIATPPKDAPKPEPEPEVDNDDFQL